VRSTWLAAECLSWINGVGIRIFIKSKDGVLVKYRTNITLLSNNNSKRLLKTLWEKKEPPLNKMIKKDYRWYRKFVKLIILQ
jgi:hypothetical protein